MRVGPFYIVKSSRTGKPILYPGFGDGLSHNDLWPALVMRLFAGKVDNETLAEMSNHPYGVLRGRVVIVEGEVIVYGVTGCEKFLPEIRSAYNLPKKIRSMVGADSHYKVIRADKVVISSVLRLL